MKRTWWYIVMLLAVMLPTACSTIDDDLSDCGNDFELDYEMRLVTNVTTELNTQLSTAAEVNVANALRSHLEDIFTDYARDVDLSFYDTEDPQERLSHDQHVMNASEKSYTLYLPMREYMHLAVANIKDNSVVNLTGDDRCPTSQLTISTGKDTIDSQTTGLFTARQSMKVLEGVDQTFHVHLYMANCAEALVINPRGQKYKDIKVYATGFATQFHINDSIYAFSEKSPIVRTQKLDTQGGNLCFSAVNFPSSADEGMKTVIETDFDDEKSSQVFWKFLVYVTREDGTVTESILNVRKPQHAGQFRIIEAYMGNDGDVGTDDTEVGVTVTLDWKDGGQHDIDI